LNGVIRSAIVGVALTLVVAIFGSLWPAIALDAVVDIGSGTIVWLALRGMFGRRLITASDDLTARVWDATMGEPLTPPLKHPCPVLRAYFSSESYQAITVSADHVVRAWSFTPDNRPVTSLVLLSQALAGSRIDEKYGVIPLTGNELRSAWQRMRSDNTISVQSLSR
jgi:hypothetical protein